MNIYNIGDRVVCKVNIMEWNTCAIIKSPNNCYNFPAFIFEIVGRRTFKDHPSFFDYILLLPKELVDNQIYDNVGWILNPSDLDVRNDSGLFQYEIDKKYIGNRLIGCYTKSIMRAANSFATCVMCDFKNEYMDETIGYICYHHK